MYAGQSIFVSPGVLLVLFCTFPESHGSVLPKPHFWFSESPNHAPYFESKKQEETMNECYTVIILDVVIVKINKVSNIFLSNVSMLKKDHYYLHPSSQ